MAQTVRRTFLVLGLVLLLSAVPAAVWLRGLSQPYQAYTGGEQFVDLLPGDGTPAIARKLVDAGVVRDRWTFRAAL